MNAWLWRVLLMKGSTAVSYLLGKFFTSRSQNKASLVNYVEQGAVGALTVYQDTGNKLSVSSGKLLMAAAVGSVNPIVTSVTSVARAAGRAVLADISSTAVYTVVGVSSNNTGASPSVALGPWSTTNWLAVNSTVAMALTQASVVGTAYPVAVVLRGTGAWLFAQLAGQWTLLWVDNAGTTSPLYAVFTSLNANSAGTLDNFRVGDLGGSFTTDYGIATSRNLVVATGTVITSGMTANAVLEHTATWNTGQDIDLRYRYTDINNYWSTLLATDGTIRIREMAAGTLTVRASAASGVSSGTTPRIVTVCDGAAITVYVVNVQKVSYALATTNQTATGMMYAASTVTAAEIVSWPRTITITEPSTYLLGPFTFPTNLPRLGPYWSEPTNGAVGALSVVDAGSRVSVSGGQLRWTGASSYGDPALYGAGCARVAGRTLFATLLRTTGSYALVGWADSAVPASFASGVYFAGNGGNVAAYDAGQTINDLAMTVGVSYDVAIVLRSGGGAVLVRGGAYTAWTLLYVFLTPSAGITYPALLNYNIDGPVSNVRVLDLPTPWNSDYGIALARSTFTAANSTNLTAITPEVGPAWVAQAGTWQITSNKALGNSGGSSPAYWVATVDSGASDVLVEASVTPNGATVAGIVLRFVDANNFWLVGVDIYAGNTVRIYEMTAGTLTARASTAVTVTDAAPHRLVAIVSGTTISAYIDNVAAGSYASATAGQSSTLHGIRTDHNDDTFDDFVIWPRTVNLPTGM